MKKNSGKTFINNLNILDGIITYNDFEIDEKIPFDDQWHMYKEDILQIKFGERFILDLGWYPEHDPKGYFKVCAILDNDWMNPLLEIKCRTLSDLKKTIEKTVIYINEMKKKELPHRNIEYESFD